MKSITNLTYDELKKIITEDLGWERYRTDQICDWIYDKKVFDFQAMTNLSKDQRKKLSETFTFDELEILDKRTSKLDGTTKYLWKLRDGNTIESVLLFYKNRVSACISTQVGCPVRCKFCATGLSGFVRNLTAGEIISQILYMEQEADVRIGNVVFMGMGEPFLNYENTIRALKILNHPKMLGIGIRHITVSTVGIPDKIISFARDGRGARLAVSLHAPTNAKRDIIVPLNVKYPLEELVQSMREYQKITGDRISVEYIMIRDFNDGESDAIKLAKLLKGLKAFVNLIPVNRVVPEFERPPFPRMRKFKNILGRFGIESEIRSEKGADIEAACGQLRLRKNTIVGRSIR